MKRIVLAAALLLIGLGVGATRSFAGPSQEIAWSHDYSTAWHQAKAQHRLLYVSVHATWCGPCQLMSRSTLRHPDVVDQVRRGCVAVHLDADRDVAVVRQLQVRAYPTELFVAPGGDVVGTMEGYKGVSEFLAGLQRAMNRAGVVATETTATVRAEPSGSQADAVAQSRQHSRAMPASQQQQDSSGTRLHDAVTEAVASAASSELVAPAQATTTGGIALSGKLTDASKEPALGGYCPVSMIEQGIMVAGAEVHRCEYAGTIYRFASASNRDSFEKDPKRYLPGEEGRCVVTWSEERRWTGGRLEFPALFGEHVYFFASAQRRNKFLNDPEFYVDRDGNAYRETPSARRATSSVQK